MVDLVKLGTQPPAKDVPEPELFECPGCRTRKRGSEMSSTSPNCLACEKKEAERKFWAEQRAAGKAAFIVHDSARGALNRGTAVAYCCSCEQIQIGTKVIKRHFDQCRRSRP